MPVPTRETPPLQDDLILTRLLKKIMKDKPRLPILPSPYLPKPQIIEHQRIAPLLNGIITLGESYQLPHILPRSHRI